MTGAARATSEPELALEAVVFRRARGEFALHIPALEVSRGSCMALVGPSGSGKTTLLHLAAGILLADAGRVRFHGVDWKALGEARRRELRITEIGLVFQELELLEHLTVRENVLLPYFANPALRLSPAVEARASELARAAGVEALHARRPRELSQGERQRVALCRALVTSPRLVLADEPTGNLDARTARRMLDLCATDVRSRGATLVMVTHDAALLDRFDRVVDLEVVAGTPAAADGTGSERSARA